VIVERALYRDGRRVADGLSFAELARACDASTIAWIGLYRPGTAELEEIAQAFDLHELAVEDAVHAHQRAKLERYGEMTFMVLRPARYLDETETVEFGEVHVFAGPRFVITLRHGESPDLQEVRRSLEARPELLARGPVSVVHAIMDRVVDDYAPVVAGIENDIDEIVDQVFGEGGDASWITLEALQEQREAVPELAFRRFHANQWTERESHWLPPGAWQACVGQPTFTDGEPVWVGVDVGGDKSASAVVWINARHHVGCEIFHGDQGVLDCLDLIRELAGRYDLREVLYDPWRFGQAAQELERERIVVTAFPQNDTRMVPASLRLYEAVVQQRLVLPDNAELRQHMGNTIARHNRRGWRLDKPSLDQPNDSIIAMCMAVEAMENQPEPAQLLAWL